MLINCAAINGFVFLSMEIPDTKKEGVGLGLSISKIFINALGGHNNVKSDLAPGSTFFISIPAAHKKEVSL